MKHSITSFSESMTRLRRTQEKGESEIEYWSAREVYGDLGYEKWDHFVNVIEKAKENCSKIGANSKNHFAEVGKMVPIGSGALREQIDFLLSRTACYLIALNADASKEEVAWAKAYFLVQTRAQEIAPVLSAADERAALREKLSIANKSLAGAAKEVGVDNFQHFNAAGIQGLYKKTISELKAHKGIEQKEEYWDRVSALELSANEFKAQLAKKTIEEKKKSGQIYGQKSAELEHNKVGGAVRDTIFKHSGVHLEDLPPEPSLKKLLSAQKKAAKAAKKVGGAPTPDSLPPME